MLFGLVLRIDRPLLGCPSFPVWREHLTVALETASHAFVSVSIQPDPHGGVGPGNAYRGRAPFNDKIFVPSQSDVLGVLICEPVESAVSGLLAPVNWCEDLRDQERWRCGEAVPSGEQVVHVDEGSLIQSVGHHGRESGLPRAGGAVDGDDRDGGAMLCAGSRGDLVGWRRIGHPTTVGGRARAVRPR